MQAVSLSSTRYIELKEALLCTWRTVWRNALIWVHVAMDLLMPAISGKTAQGQKEGRDYFGGSG